MTTKELIYQQINKISEHDLDDLYQLIKEFARTRKRARKPGVMEKLRAIEFDGPEDFAANLDLYLSGEKSAEPHIR